MRLPSFTTLPMRWTDSAATAAGAARGILPAARTAADNRPGWPLGRPRTGGRQLAGRMPHRTAGHGWTALPAGGGMPQGPGRPGRPLHVGGRQEGGQRRGGGARRAGRREDWWRLEPGGPLQLALGKPGGGRQAASRPALLVFLFLFLYKVVLGGRARCVRHGCARTVRVHSNR